MENRPLNLELVESADGSHTIRVEALKEHYHSHRGAIQESLHVFIESGLKAISGKESLKILEVGFGTGLNALLSVLENPRPRLHYTALEAYPLDALLINQLNYPDRLSINGAEEYFKLLHGSPWNQEVQICTDFTIIKIIDRIETVQFEHSFDLIYYDAFAPHAQPELWTLNLFEKLYQITTEDGILVTYCAKGQVRRDLQKAGFEVERLPGPPGKREMLRARRTVGVIQPM